MGGCCCHSARRTESHGPPVYYYCPEDFEEDEPLSSTHDPPSAVPVLPVDTVPATSIADSCQEPNAPHLHEDFSHTQSNTGRVDNSAKNEYRQPTDGVPMEDIRRDRFEGSDNCDDLKESEHKSVSDFNITLKILGSLQNVSTIFTCHAFLNGLRGAIPAPYVIRSWRLIIWLSLTKPCRYIIADELISFLVCISCCDCGANLLFQVLFLMPIN